MEGYQSGRYRLTDHEPELEEILPAVEALREGEASVSFGNDAYAHTTDLSPDNSDGYRMHEAMHTLDVCTHTPPVCEPYANANAYTNDLKNNDKSPPYARMHGNQGGEAPVAPSCRKEEEINMSDTDHHPFDCLKDKSPVPELPAFLDRRNPPQLPRIGARNQGARRGDSGPASRREGRRVTRVFDQWPSFF